VGLGSQIIRTRDYELEHVTMSYNVRVKVEPVSQENKRIFPLKKKNMIVLGTIRLL